MQNDRVEKCYQRGELRNSFHQQNTGPKNSRTRSNQPAPKTRGKRQSICSQKVQ